MCTSMCVHICMSVGAGMFACACRDPRLIREVFSDYSLPYSLRQGPSGVPRIP